MTRMKNVDHVVHISKGNTLLCRHCGSHYAIALPAPVTMVTAQWGVFLKEHRACKLLSGGLACSACFAFGHEREQCKTLAYHGDAWAWFNGPDTGMSSKTLWRHMMGVPIGSIDKPWDPADFGRCHRLLEAFPAWRARIGEMAIYPAWKPLVENWGELTALYVEEHPTGFGPKLFARIVELEGR